MSCKAPTLKANVDFICSFIYFALSFRNTKCTRPYYVFSCRVEKYFLFALIFPQRGFYRAGGKRIKKRRRPEKKKFLDQTLVTWPNVNKEKLCCWSFCRCFYVSPVQMPKPKIQVISEAATDTHPLRTRLLLVEWRPGGCRGRPPPGGGG